jgi:peptidyl-prolyl cis-trans isomerase C
MIQFEILAQEAQRRGLDRDPEVVLEMKQAMVRRMMADELSREAMGEVPEEELRAWYEEHKGDYVRPAKVRASQIVQPDEASLRKVLKELQKAFKEDPSHKRRIFALKAKAVSTDKTTSKLGGDMRFFAHPKDGGTVSKEVADVAFALKDVGQLSEPFKSDKGWHVLMLTARKQRYERTFEDVKRSIANRLLRERRSLREQKFVDDVKAKAQIDIKEDLLNTIPDPELPKGQGITPHKHEDHEGNTTEVIQGKEGEDAPQGEDAPKKDGAPAQGDKKAP